MAAALLLGLSLVWLPLPVATIILLGTALFLFTLIQPLFGLALALLAGPFGALEQLLSGSLSLDSGQLLLMLALAAWMARSLAQRRLTLSYTSLNLPFFLLILIASLSLLGARSIDLGAKELLKWLEMLLIMLMVVDLGRSKTYGADKPSRQGFPGGQPRTFWIVGMLLLAGTSQALIGIWQFALRADGPEHFLVLDRFYRAYGTYEQPNPFGGFMNLGVLLALGVLAGLIGAFWHRLRQRSLDEKKGQPGGAGLRIFIMIVVVALIAAFTGMALLFSWSRGAWMGFAAGIAVLLLFWPRKRRYGVLLLGSAFLLILLALGAGLLPQAVASRLTGFAQDFTPGDVRGVDINDDNYSVLERQAHWQAGLNMLRDDVWLGSGFGNYAAAYPDYALINWPDPLGHAHNYYINLLAEVGVLGLVAYLIFWSAVFWQTIRLLRCMDWPERGIALGLLGVWVALVVHHLVDKLYVNNIYIHLGVLLGLLQLLAWQVREARDMESAQIASRI